MSGCRSIVRHTYNNLSSDYLSLDKRIVAEIWVAEMHLLPSQDPKILGEEDCHGVIR